MFRSSNPTLKAFDQPQALASPAAQTMTFGGTLAKTGILLGLCTITAVTSWDFVSRGSQSGGGTLALLGSLIGALILSFVISAAPRTAPFLAPVYAILEGAVIGVVSWFIPQYFNKAPEGMVLQAVGLTMGISAALLITYSLGLVRIGSTAAKAICVACAGVCIYYTVVLVLNLCGVPYASLGWQTNWLGIGFSLLVVVLASLALVLDFQCIEAGVERGAPKHMEWYGAFSLMVTLVWLYIEVLRLLSKLNRR
jgi:uncharacterized YccA/Bax inhibitor family protein